MIVDFGGTASPMPVDRSDDVRALQHIFLPQPHPVFYEKTTTPTCSCDADVCIVGVARTPMGGFLGTLSSLPATKLGTLKRAHVHANLVQEVFFGKVLSANLGQAPARQAALGAGIPNSVVCTTISKVCSSGMKALAEYSCCELQMKEVDGGEDNVGCIKQALGLGMPIEDFFGTEIKDGFGHLNDGKGSRLGHDMVIDGMLKDGLWDVYNDYAMGMCAELYADQRTITREEQKNGLVLSVIILNSREKIYMAWLITYGYRVCYDELGPRQGAIHINFSVISLEEKDELCPPIFPALDSISTSISLQIHGNRGISRLIPHHMKHSISTPSFGRHSGGGRDPR
ncbi:hypothetical protein MRB53_023202 [Persea americana]|uniref:Uncharacterized protein n=1 Tax=Persea americana TaxID=3435 RepID=A0ACC2LA13_PERAE|nr:hypothetical protein MRB53_023202 [Persea americana]